MDGVSREMKNIEILDKLSIGLSAVCLIHCLVLPLLLLFAPLGIIPFLTEEEVVHKSLLYVVLPLSSYTLILGCKKHKNFKILGLGLSGLSILIISTLFGHDTLGHEGEKYASVVGSIIIAISHYLNHKSCKKGCHV